MLGYQAAQEIVVAASAKGKSIRQMVIERGMLTGEQFDALVSPESVTRLGHPRKRGYS
jgi:aspartate ammonia-lyase